MPVFTFSNFKPISFSDDRDLRISYAADPYPSQINVFGLPQDINDIAIRLYGLSAEILNELSIFLVGPDNKANLILLNAIGYGSKPQNQVDIIVATHGVPMPSDSPLENHIYCPTSYYYIYPPADSPNIVYSQPAPMDCNTFQSAFLEDPLNKQLDGIWSLYVFSSGTRISPFGIRGGWEISFYTKYH